MRLTRIALTVVLGTMVLSGCSARNAGPGEPIGLSGSVPAESGYSNYDSDPPRTSGNRMAIQPNPVPPARGISHIRGISHRVQLFGHAGCAEADCKAPVTICPDEGCDSGDCVEEGCGPKKGPGYLDRFSGLCHDGLCSMKDRCVAGGHSVKNFYDGEVVDRLHRWKKSSHSKLVDLCHDDCGEAACGDLECGDKGCTPDECGDSGCTDMRRSVRPLCPCPEPKVISGKPCVPDYGCPCESPAPVHCTPEGCNHSGHGRAGLLDGLKGHVRINRYFFKRWMPGDYCSTESGCTPDAGPCTTEVCEAPCGEGCDRQHSSAARDCRPSPLADCMADPFVEDQEHATPLLPQPAAPAIPDAPAIPQPASPAPLQPAAPKDLTPLSPVPEQPTSQATMDPPAWPRLQQSENGRPTVESTIIRPRTTYPVSW